MASYKILSCDGGGIRGFISSLILERLEEKLGSPLCNHFDMFAGTSTGSIIACCLSQGLSISVVKDFYLDRGKDIFPDMDFRFWADHAFNQMKKGDASLPLFTSEGLEKVLKDPQIFPPDKLFGNSLKPTLVVAYDAYNRTAAVFKSTFSKFAQIPTWEVCRSSAAAPVAFPGYFLTEKNYLEHIEETAAQKGDSKEGVNNPLEIAVYKNKKGIPLIDGGVVANNPALCALSERINMNHSCDAQNKCDLGNIIVASFGTGQSMGRITPDEAETWGGLDWINMKNGFPLMDVFSDGSADSTDYILSQMIGDNYYRFQPLLEAKVSTFQATSENFENMNHCTSEYLKDYGDAYLDKLIETLKTS